MDYFTEIINKRLILAMTRWYLIALTTALGRLFTYKYSIFDVRLGAPLFCHDLATKQSKCGGIWPICSF